MSEEVKRNVYVGHRYVPKVMGEWNKEETYEGLCIVTYQGTSYTSKKRVPIGVDILNEEYWVVTGNYNAQVENYRQEVTNLTNYVNSEMASKADQVDLDETNQQLDERSKYITPTGTEDDTDYLQQIINENSHIIFKKGTYFINATKMQEEGIKTGLRVPSNRIIEWEEGAVFETIPNNSPHYRVMDLFGANNVTLRNPTFIGDRDEHNYSEEGTHEFGHGLYLSTSKNVDIYNATCNNFTGDGMAVYYGEDVYIENLMCDNNRRQGISIGHAKNLTINGATLSNTNGTNPECGIDLEPNYTTDFLTNIKLIDILTINNAQTGIMIVPQEVKNSTEPMTITITNHIDQGSTYGFSVGRYQPNSKISGFIRNENPKYYDNKGSGIIIGGYSEQNTPTLEIINPTVVNPNTGNNPAIYPYGTSGIVIYRPASHPDTSTIGNILISNPTITDNRSVKLTTFGIYIEDKKLIGLKNVNIIDPFITGLDINSKVSIYENVNFIDGLKTLSHDTPESYLPLNNKSFTKLTNTGATTITQINIRDTFKINTVTEFVNTTTLGMMIVPENNVKILPLSNVSGGFIKTTQPGASIALRKLNDTTFLIENMVGDWVIAE